MTVHAVLGRHLHTHVHKHMHTDTNLHTYAAPVIISIFMKASSQSLKQLLAEFLKKGERSVLQRTELAIVAMDDDCVRVTDDYVHYFEMRGIIYLTAQNIEMPSKA